MNRVEELQKQQIFKKLDSLFDSVEKWSKEHCDDVKKHLVNNMKLKKKDADTYFQEFLNKNRPWSELVRINDSRVFSQAEIAWAKLRTKNFDEQGIAIESTFKWFKQSFPAVESHEYPDGFLKRLFVVEYIFEKWSEEFEGKWKELNESGSAT